MYLNSVCTSTALKTWRRIFCMEDFTSGTLDRKNLMYIREYSYIVGRPEMFVII